MTKFWDIVYLVFFINAFTMTTPILMGFGFKGIVLLLVMWVLFWSWFNATFVSISYIKETLEKAGKNDNKDSGSTNT